MLKTIIIITIVTLLVSSVGWKKFIYFFSLGYGYGIASIAITLAVLYWKDLSWYSAAMLVLLWPKADLRKRQMSGDLREL